MLINNDTHQRETVSERPIRPPLSVTTPNVTLFGVVNTKCIVNVNRINRIYLEKSNITDRKIIRNYFKIYRSLGMSPVSCHLTEHSNMDTLLALVPSGEHHHHPDTFVG